MSAFARFAAVVPLLALASACSDLVTGGDLIRPGAATGTIEVVNATAGSITAVLISACDVGSYGLNRLPDGYVLYPRDRYDFTVSAGCWDVDAGNDGGEARQRMQIQPGGGVEYTVEG